ncbi:PAS domain-containing protein [Sphingomonas sp. PsM26]|nr:PAS domain-containing protein [Sphingomonas sp. PsM26]
MSLPDLDYAGLFDGSPNPYLVLDRDLNIAGANRAYLNSVKRELPEILGRWAWDAFPSDAETVRQAVDSFERVKATGRPDTMALLRFDVPRPDAQGGGMERRFWSITHVPVFDAGGKVTLILQHPIDVTELERLREAVDTESRGMELYPEQTGIFERAQHVYAENQKLATEIAKRTADRNRLWEMSADIILIAGFDGTMEAVNPAWTEVLGWREEELVGRSLLDLIHPDDLTHTLEGTAGILQGAALRNFENRYRNRDGSYRTLSWTAGPGDGRIVAIGRDVTEELLRASALAKAEEQLRQSQKMEAVGQLTGGLAHDFNNLLTAVTGGLELLGHRVAAGQYDKLDRYMSMALTGAQRAAALTQRLLAFSRRQTLAPVATDTDRLVAGMSEIIDRTLGPSIELHFAATAGLWPVLVDAPQLENALLNLCINARDAMPDGGRLTIETSNKTLDARAAAAQDLPEGDYVSLCVTDTGTGMSSDIIERVFDPFFTTKPLGEGTGLGLSMIYGFVRQSGGQVRIYSEVGQGTTMCLYLPRLVGTHDLSQLEQAPAARHRAEQGQTVLLVEDEAAIRELVSEILGDAGYRVLTASNGPLGVALLQSDERIDLLVTDVGLPGGLNGRQVADAGRVTRPGLRVLFVTGYAANAAVGAGHLDEGMSVLTKPFNVLELERRVSEMIVA